MPGGFYWTANSPYVRGFWLRVRRSSKTLGVLPADKAIIMSPDGQRANSNPAHMIYECLTNTDWGQGSSPLSINTASFIAAANTLFDEKFGLSMLWVRQDTIENFVSEILDHIQAYLYLDPRTGLQTIKLLRGDYDAATLDVIGEDVAKVTKFQRKGFGETINEIVVSWTNPENEQEETVTVQDLANIVSQGGQIVSDTRKYYAVRDSMLAVTVGARDLRVSAAPLATGEISVDRSAWSKTPGDVVILNFPSKKIYNMIVRLGEISYGDDDDGRVIASFTEDIFGLDTALYVAPPSTEWQDPSAPPAPMTYQRIFTVPAFLVANYVNNNTFDVALEYPEVAAGILAAASNPGTVSYELVGNITLANGQVVASSLGTRTVLGHAKLIDALPAEDTSLVEAFKSFMGTAPFLAGFVIFDGGSDDKDEIAMIQSIAAEGFTLVRGVMDTVPRAWPANTNVWFVNLEQNFADETIRSAGETVSYRLLTRTDQGLLALEDATTLTGVLGERPHLPNRPAKVTVAGSAFGPVALDGAGPFAITWATRNRTMETSQIVPWSYSSVIPETGQTTVVEVLRPDRTVAFTAEGLAGETYNLASASLGALTAGFIRVSSQRDEFPSLQGLEVPFTRVAPPYTVAISGNMTENPPGTFTKTSGTDGWNADGGSFRSNETFAGDLNVTWKAGTSDKYLMVGLTSTPGADNSFQTIDFACYTNNAGTVEVYLAGTQSPLPGGVLNYAVGDTFKVSRDATAHTVKMYKNGVEFFSVADSANAPLGMDSSFYSVGGKVTDVVLSRTV